MQKSKGNPCSTLHESSFTLLYLISPSGPSSSSGRSIKIERRPCLSVFVCASSLALTCHSLCWSWLLGAPRRPSGWRMCPQAPARPGRAAGTTGASYTSHPVVEMILLFCYVLTPGGRWLAKSECIKLWYRACHKLNVLKKVPVVESCSSGRVPVALTLTSCPPWRAWAQRPGLGSDRWDVLCPLAPGENTSNISLMWWHLARRLQLSPWESSVVSRLLTPTHSFLARSKSTAALSGDAGKTTEARFLARWSLGSMSAPPVFLCLVSIFPCASLLWVERLWGYPVGTGSMPLALLPLRVHLSILLGRDAGRQRMSRLRSGGFRCFRLCLTWPEIPILTCPSSPASEQVVTGRHKLIFDTNVQTWEWNQSRSPLTPGVS